MKVSKKFIWLLTGLSVFWLVVTAAAGVKAQETELETVYVEVRDVDGSARPQAKTSAGKGRSVLTDWSYGDQLTGNQTVIYEALADTEDMRTKKAGTVSSMIKINLETPYQFTDTANFKTEAAWAQMQKDYTKAVHAYLKDYAEQYWIKTFGISYYSPTQSRPEISVLYLAPSDYYNSTTEPAGTYANIRDELSGTDSAFADAVAAIEGSSRYETVKSIHEYVASLVTYPASTTKEYYHTITGGLLEKYNHEGVCECYAKLFQMLCQEKGIPGVLIVGGSALNADGTVNATHMWNYVLMDDLKWYLVDVTWDDQAGGLRTNYFLAGSSTSGFNGKKVSDDHMPVGSFGGTYTPFAVPALAADSYETNHPDKISREDVTSVVLDDRQVNMKCGEKETITAAVTPEGAETSNLQWSVSDSDVVGVTVRGADVVITAKKPGTVTLNVINTKNYLVKASCLIRVEHSEGETATCTKAQTCTGCGEVLAKALGHEPGSAATCTKEQTCTRCSAVLTKALGHEPGSAATCTKPQTCTRCSTVLAKALGHKAGDWQITKQPTGISAGIKVRKCTVCQTVLQKQTLAKLTVTLNAKELPLQLKKSTTVLKVLNKSAGDSVKEWKTSNKKIVAVNKVTGKLTAKKTGKAVITVVMKSGAQASCKITVQKGKVKTRKLALTKTSVTLARNKSLTIVPIRTPLTATDKITFKSSNKKVATVSSKGKIVAKKRGKATITAKVNGKKVSIKVTVK